MFWVPGLLPGHKEVVLGGGVRMPGTNLNGLVEVVKDRLKGLMESPQTLPVCQGQHYVLHSSSKCLLVISSFYCGGH